MRLLYAAIYGGAKVTLLDYSNEALEFAKMVAQELQKRGKQFEVTFIRDNLESLTLQEQFDIVTNEGVLEHWFTFEERKNILSEMSRVTKPGGTVIIWVPNIHNPLYRRWIKKYAEVPERAFSVAELETLFTEVGLEKIKVFPVRAYQFTLLSRFKFIKPLGVYFWLLEMIVPGWILKGYLSRFGYQLVAIGRKPLE
ncbi:MAG: methyltransferase domain-containing protein [Candidatus Bathyarchaeia archaeon]